jgi:arginine/ornithine transport system permease protein
MRWEIIFQPTTLALYGEGLLTTMGLLLACLAIGGVLAVVFALALTHGPAPLRWLVGGYTYVIRGTPLLIQLYLIYYGLAQLDWIQARWDAVWPWTMFKDAFFCALLAFSLNTAGYTAEMLAGSVSPARKAMYFFSALRQSSSQIDWRFLKAPQVSRRS